jgi:hypothetical protein
VARIVIFGPRTGRYGRSTSTTKYVSLGFLSLAQRLELLRRHKVRVAQSPTRRRYRAQADEYRFQAETFRDPKTQAQIHRLAEIYERKAMQAEKWGNSKEEDNGQP